MTPEQRADALISEHIGWLRSNEKEWRAVVDAIRTAEVEATARALGPLADEIAGLLRAAYVDEGMLCNGAEPDCYQCRAVRALRAMGRGP